MHDYLDMYVTLRGYPDSIPLKKGRVVPKTHTHMGRTRWTAVLAEVLRVLRSPTGKKTD